MIRPPEYGNRVTLTPTIPIGKGTAFVECLTSVMSRTAAAHLIPTSTLLLHVLAPHLRSFERTDKRKTFHRYVVNGSIEFTPAYCSVLRDLTGQEELERCTFLPLLSSKFVPFVRLSKVKRWCRQCLREANDERTPFYEPLLFQLADVTVCPRHRSRLDQACAHCGLSKIPVQPSREVLGFCPRCYRWLGDGDTAKVTGSSDRAKYEMWLADAASDLVAGIDSGSYKANAPAATMIEEGIRRLFDGSANAFAAALHRSKSTISGWRRGKVLPDFRGLCDMSYAFHVPLRLLAEIDVTAWDVAVPRALPHGDRPGKLSRRPLALINRKLIEQELQALADGRDQATISVASIARKYGVDPKVMFDVSPAMRHLAIKHAQQNRTRVDAERKSEREALVRSAVLSAAREMASRGTYPSRRKLIAHLERHGLHIRHTEFPLVTKLAQDAIKLVQTSPSRPAKP